MPGDKVTGLGGKSRGHAFWKGLGFIGRMLSKKGRETDVHAKAAADKDNETTNFVIGFLKDKKIH